jgi:hypothetical protein
MTGRGQIIIVKVDRSQNRASHYLANFARAEGLMRDLDHKFLAMTFL